MKNRSADRAHQGNLREVLSPRGEPFEIVGRAGPVEPHAAPPILAETREELLVIKDRELFLCARPDGEVVPAQVTGEGFYANDTRYLSEVRLEVDGAALVPLSSSAREGRAVLDATNATLESDLRQIPQMSLAVSREVLVACGRLYYVVSLRSFLREPVRAAVSLVLASDFADMFEVRGASGRTARGHLLGPKFSDAGLILAYIGEDDAFRETVIEFEPKPERSELGLDRARVSWSVELEPQLPARLMLTAEPSVGGRRRRRRRFETAGRELRHEEDAWRSQCAGISSDNELLNGLVAATLRDLRALIVPAPGGQIVAAGIPWYVAPFGRDALITGTEALMLNPALARDALVVLAKLQAREEDPWRDAEPGKILHELRVGELAGAGAVPHTPYYGSVDSTPLFVLAAAEYFRWSGDLETLQALRPALDNALAWIDGFGDRDGDGFVEYERRSSGGLENQGWKDSEDAIVHADGSLAEGPIALVEVQGYVYAAKEGIAPVYEALGDPDVARRLRAEARDLRDAFDAAFWNAEEGTYALALDGRKRQVASVASNAGHALFCGIVPERRADAVAERLLAPDMFSGWGVRTLSSEVPAFNPMSYHNGSVWPHDNAIIAAGLKRYGYDAAALQICACLLEVAYAARDSRLPELFCGFARAERAKVVDYPVACSPQAWAAAAPLLALQSALGISAAAGDRALRIERPRLPPGIGQLRLEGLRVGEASVTIEFDRSNGTTGFALIDQRGAVDVTMAAG